ncbi:MAG: hypothetical protein L0154_10555 [Chloroflexi bacterium]|nr:hypothetical protein [Chloroflexota bacterium]
MQEIAALNGLIDLKPQPNDITPFYVNEVNTYYFLAHGHWKHMVLLDVIQQTMQHMTPGKSYYLIMDLSRSALRPLEFVRVPVREVVDTFDSAGQHPAEVIIIVQNDFVRNFGRTARLIVRGNQHFAANLDAAIEHLKSVIRDNAANANHS